jgi:hypothetical protein
LACLCLETRKIFQKNQNVPFPKRFVVNVCDLVDTFMEFNVIVGIEENI